MSAGTYSTAIGDLNGDGKPDLVSANGDAENVSVRLGNGDGTFQAATTYAVGVGPISVAIRDLGNGKPDIITANSSSVSLSVLVGNGDGTFQSAVSYPVATNNPAGGNPRVVKVADLSGDGKPDLVTANNGGGNVSVLLGNGDGTFQAAVNYSAGGFPVSVSVGDLNGNGKPDLAVVDRGGSGVSVLLGNGDGSFQAPVSYAVGAFPSSVAIGDLDGNGKPDLVVANSLVDSVSVLRGNGDGTFQAAVNYTVGTGPWSVGIGDLNGDGSLDVAVANSGSPNGPSSGANTVSVLLGNGDGTLRSAVSYTVGNGPSSIAIGDLNADGRPDLAVSNFFAANVSVLLNTSTGPATGVAVGLSPGSIVANGASTSTVTATVTDSHGNPVAGDSVGFSASDVGVHFGSVTDHGDGTYTATVTSSTTVHAITITATDSSPAPSVAGQTTLMQTPGPATGVDPGPNPTPGPTTNPGPSAGPTPDPATSVTGPSGAEIRRLLLRILVPRGKAARIAELSRRHGYSFAFDSPTAGRLSVSWYRVSRGAHVTKAKPKPVLVARAAVLLSKAGRARIKIALTSNGTRLLRHAAKLQLTAKGAFTPAGAQQVSATKTFSVSR